MIKRSAGLAFILSLLLPGLGHFYCRKVRRGLWLLLLCALPLLFVLLLLASGGGSLQVTTNFIFFPALYVFAFLDAYFTVRENNAGFDWPSYGNPRVAAVLNLVTRGFGYFYVGQTKKGLMIFVGLGALSAWLLIMGPSQSIHLWLAVAIEALGAGMAVDAYRIAKRGLQEEPFEQLGLASRPPIRAAAIAPSRLTAAIPVGFACLFGAVYVGVAAGLLTVGERGSTSWERLNQLCESELEAGRYTEAEKHCSTALTEAEDFGPADPRLATSLNYLAELYRAQGKYAEAEPLYQRALAIWEKALGPEHPIVATSLNNLALLYRDQGKYAEAEPLLQRALAIYEEVLGPEHPNVAAGLNNLAQLYDAQGKYAEAEPRYKRALKIVENVLGPEHPNVAATLDNLAELYRAQGKYAEAEALYQRALAILEKSLGAENPQVATGLNNLALLYDTQGKYAEAEALHRRALAIDEKVLGPEHPGVATDLENYAALLRKTNRDAGAAKMEARAQAIRA